MAPASHTSFNWQVEVSHPDRVMFPERGLTKADVVAHYQQVAPRMLTFLHGRPLTLQRFPKGVTAKGFMQKNAGKHFPESIRRYDVPKRDGGTTRYPVVTNAEDLPYLANQGTITFHMWTATTDRPNHPDWMVMDLDPEADDLHGVHFATRAVGEILADFDLRGFVVATGSKGYHIWVPLTGEAAFDHVSLAARAIAGIAASAHPDRLTTEFLKKNRGRRVFVDWLRNTGIATVVVPFSLRPRPSAPVAVPLRWEELEESTPDGVTAGHLGNRLDIDIEIAPRSLHLEPILEAARAAGVDLETPHDRFGRK